MQEQTHQENNIRKTHSGQQKPGTNNMQNTNQEHKSGTKSGNTQDNKPGTHQKNTIRKNTSANKHQEITL